MSESIKLIHHRVNQKHPDDIHASVDADADTGVTTIALPLLCTDKLKIKVGRSKPPLVLTGYNRPGQYSLKWSILVITGQYWLEWSIGIFRWLCFCDGLIYWARLWYSYLPSTRKEEKMDCFSPAKGTHH